MVNVNADVFRSRFKELQEKSLDDICMALNNEYEERFYVRNGEIYVDCSDFSRIDVKIS